MKERIVQEWFGGCNRRDWDTVKKLYAEDAVIHGKEGILRGGDGVVALAKSGSQKFLKVLSRQFIPLVKVMSWLCTGAWRGH